MARKSTKTPTQQISEALNGPIGEYLCEVADRLGISDNELKERLAAKLDNDDPMDWDVILPEYQPLIEAIARDLEAEASVRRLEPTTEASIEQQAPVSEAESEPPILEEEPQPEKKKRSKRQSALTKKKTEAIQDNRQAATQTNAGISETLTLLQAQQGLIDSSQAGTAYLATYTANLTNVKGEGLTVIAAQMLQEISQKSGFDPNEILKQVGVPLAPETQQKLQETMGQVLGNVQHASTEIQQTSWGNGYNLQTDLGNLENLMNSND